VKVAVVCCGDFPDSVHATERLAEEYVEGKPKKSESGRDLYWRIYEYEVQGRVPETDLVRDLTASLRARRKA
jgi:hypothetical protein